MVKGYCEQLNRPVLSLLWMCHTNKLQIHESPVDWGSSWHHDPLLTVEQLKLKRITSMTFHIAFSQSQPAQAFLSRRLCSLSVNIPLFHIFWCAVTTLWWTITAFLLLHAWKIDNVFYLICINLINFLSHWEKTFEMLQRVYSTLFRSLL